MYQNVGDQKTNMNLTPSLSQFDILNLYSIIIWILFLPVQVDPFDCEAYLINFYTFHYCSASGTRQPQCQPGTGARPWWQSSCDAEIFYPQTPPSLFLRPSCCHWWFYEDYDDCLLLLLNPHIYNICIDLGTWSNFNFSKVCIIKPIVAFNLWQAQQCAKNYINFQLCNVSIL